jgi:hypothetical protein
MTLERQIEIVSLLIFAVGVVIGLILYFVFSVDIDPAFIVIIPLFVTWIFYALFGGLNAIK